LPGPRQKNSPAKKTRRWRTDLTAFFGGGQSFAAERGREKDEKIVFLQREVVASPAV
jgi:hypothetical protein